MRRFRSFVLGAGAAFASLFVFGACGGRILQGETTFDAGDAFDASSSDASASVDAAVHCDSIPGSTKPTGESKGFFYPDSVLLQDQSIRGFAVGDVNGDGRNDLVVATSSGLDILHQNACGGLDAPITQPGAYGRLAIGDLTRDGLADLVATSEQGGFAFFTQLPDGTLSLANSYTVQTGESVTATGGAPILGNFNGDKYADLFTGDSLGSVYLQRAKELDLGLLLTVPNAGMTIAYAKGDFDGDGRDDIVAASADELVTFLQKPDGGFTTIVNPVSFDYYAPLSIAVGDFTDDHHDDVALGLVTGPSTSALAVFPQVDAGVFGTPELTSTDSTGAVASADIDGDGRTDVVEGNGAIYLFLQTAPGKLTETPSPYGRSNGSFFVLADLDGDGKPDLVATAQDTGSTVTSLVLAYHVP